MTLLERIIEDRKRRQPISIDRQKLERLRQDCALRPPVRSLRGALETRPAVIAEIKRRSPSRQEFPGFRDPLLLGPAYEAAGAAAISVLTNESFFGMRKQDLSDVAANVRIPVLRKEFIISEYDVLETRLLGADAVLLIVRLLGEAQLGRLHALAREVGLEVLIEVHSEAELHSALRLEPGLIGINARDLDSLKVDLDRALAISRAVPPEVRVVAESGIANRGDIERFRRDGIHAFLIGTELLMHDSPEQRLAELLSRELANEPR